MPRTIRARWSPPASPLPRVAIFAANASSTRRASAAARLFFAAMIRCAQAAASSAEFRPSTSVSS